MIGVPTKPPNTPPAAPTIMNNRLPSLVILGCAALLLAACESTPQGPSPALANQTAAPVGQRIEPAPVSQAYPGAKDVFRAAEYKPSTGPSAPGAQHIRMRLGQLVEVYRGSFAPGDGQREMAFYLPVEARPVVQLIVETKGFTRTYFLRAIGPGDTVGGVVERRWLGGNWIEGLGFSPNNAADEARIQNAIRTAPYLISVYN